MFGKGFYFTDDIEYAKTYNRNNNAGSVLEVYLKIAENNFKLKNYEGCIKNLEEVIDRSSVDSTNVKLFLVN